MHKKANVHRLLYRREQHLILYVFNLKKYDINLDKREIPTRGYRGVRTVYPESKK